MNLKDLQTRLARTGHYDGVIDGIAGPETKAALLEFVTDGPDFRLEASDFEWAASDLTVPVPYVRALYEVESSGNAFVDGRPTILPEPHIFSRLTNRRYDHSHPRLSSRQWNRALYPGSQSGRWAQLIDMVCLDPLAGFGSASYGGFQILGCNYSRCDVRDSMAFAWQESQSEADQLRHFVAFIKSDPVLWQALKAGNWVHVAKRYNGTAYYKNRYDVKLAQAVRRWS